MPHKFNSDRRHKFERARYRVTNWTVYNEGLRRRGDLTVWLSEAALESWSAPRRTTKGGQPGYSDLAIELCLTLRTVFRLALRQTQGLMRSIAKLMGLDVQVPDFSTLSRRAPGLTLSTTSANTGPGAIHLVVDSTGLKVFGEGKWLRDKHKIKGKRRTWRKLHLGLDPASGEIGCATLTPHDTGDTSALNDLLAQVNAPVSRFLADGAYDGAPTQAALQQRFGPDVEIVIPPPKNAVPSLDAAHTPTVRDRHLTEIRRIGRIAWQRSTGYNQRSRIETQIGRWKGVIGAKLQARRFDNQITETHCLA